MENNSRKNVNDEITKEICNGNSTKSSNDKSKETSHEERKGTSDENGKESPDENGKETSHEERKGTSDESGKESPDENRKESPDKNETETFEENIAKQIDLNGNEPQFSGDTNNTKKILARSDKKIIEEIDLEYMAGNLEMHTKLEELIETILLYSRKMMDLNYVFPELIEKIIDVKNSSHLVPLRKIGSHPILPIIVPEKYGKLLTDTLFEANKITLSSLYKKNGLCHFNFDTINIFLDVWRLLRIEDIPFHFFDPRDKKVVKLVIKGIPSYVSSKKILSHLLLFYPVKYVYRMTKGSNKIPLPFLLVHVRRSDKVISMYKITNILGFDVKVESLKRSEYPTQCFRCQGFFHAARWCHAPPKCVRCAGNHLSKACNFSKNDKNCISCVNCDGKHTANFKLCPVFLKHKEYMKYIIMNRVPTDIDTSESYYEP